MPDDDPLWVETCSWMNYIINLYLMGIRLFLVFEWHKLKVFIVHWHGQKLGCSPPTTMYEFDFFDEAMNAWSDGIHLLTSTKRSYKNQCKCFPTTCVVHWDWAPTAKYFLIKTEANWTGVKFVKCCTAVAIRSVIDFRSSDVHMAVYRNIIYIVKTN
jgi:hypothetical protein